jgi:hypothetical protein
VTKALDFSLADRKAELLRWLSEEGRFAPDTVLAIDRQPSFEPYDDTLRPRRSRKLTIASCLSANFRSARARSRLIIEVSKRSPRSVARKLMPMSACRFSRYVAVTTSASWP